MKHYLSKLIGVLKGTAAPQVLLLFGDELQVEEARDIVLENIVPEDRRDFNFERFDGRSATWDQIEASLMTAPFFPGKKLIWVENAPYFFTREQKGEIGEKIIEVWRDGRPDDAVHLLVDVLVLEGWTQEQWDHLDQASTRELLRLLEIDGGEVPDAARADADALLAYAKGREIDLGQRKMTQGHRLLQLLEKGLPEWSCLLLTAPQVDRRTRLYKRLEEAGVALHLGLERDRSGKVTRDTVLEFITQGLRQYGKTAEPQALDMLVARSDRELLSLKHEVDKLVLFVGEQPVVCAVDVETICADRADGWIFDFTRAIGERDAASALSQLARLLAHGEHPLRLLGTMTSEARRLLAARQLLETDLARVWRRGISYQQFQRTVLPNGTPLLTRNPYGDYLCFQRAAGFTVSELRGYLEGLFDADHRLKSSGGSPRLVLEKLILGTCLGRQKSKKQDPPRLGV